MTKNLIRKVEQFAKLYCKNKIIESDYEDQKLWDNHVQIARKFALKLAKIEKVDKELIEIAILLHDIGKYKGREGHEKRGYRLAKKFLSDFDLPSRKVSLILKCIAKHSGRFAGENDEIELKIIRSADALGTLYDEDWQNYSRETLSKGELLALYDKTFKKVSLASARKIALPQLEKLKRLL